jgi:Spy/CpxP family protein refolding chaperone
MRKSLISLILLSAVAFLATACCPHRHAWGSKDPSARAEMITKHLTKKLDLSADQQAKVQPLIQALIQERETWRGEGPKAIEQLKAQFQSDHFDSKAMLENSDARLAKLQKSRDLVLEKLAEFHAILTPAQRAKAAEALGRLEEHLAEHSKR